MSWRRMWGLKGFGRALSGLTAPLGAGQPGVAELCCVFLHILINFLVFLLKIRSSVCCIAINMYPNVLCV